MQRRNHITFVMVCTMHSLSGLVCNSVHEFVLLVYHLYSFLFYFFLLSTFSFFHQHLSEIPWTDPNPHQPQVMLLRWHSQTVCG